MTVQRFRSKFLLKLSQRWFERLCLSTVLTFGKIFGVLPVAMEKPSDSRNGVQFRTSRLGESITFIHLALSIWCLTFLAKNQYVKETETNPSTAITNLAIASTIPISSITTIVLTLLYRRKMILKCLVVSYGFLQEGKQLLPYYPLILFFFILVIRHVIYFTYRIETVLLFFCHCVLFAKDMLISTLCLIIERSFKQVNSALTSLKTSTKKSGEKELSALTRLYEKYAEIADLVLNVQRCFCLDFIICVPLFTIHGVVDTYRAVEVFTATNGQEASIASAFGLASNLAFMTGRFLYLCYCSTAFTRQGKLTVRCILSYKLDHFFTMEDKNKILVESFLSLLNQAEIKLSACNIYDVDLSLFSAFTETAVTLIIVLIQFNDGEW